MDEKNNQNILIEKMTNALFSFSEFLKEFRQVVSDEIISDEQKKNSNVNISYSFRKYKIECYIVDKKYFNEFYDAIKYGEISDLLKVRNEENEEKCKQKVKKFLESKNYEPPGNKIKCYASQESLKNIVKQLGNYSFLNKELLIDFIGVPEENLKSKSILISKNNSNTSIMNVEEKFIMTINAVKKSEEKNNKEKEKEKEIKKEEENKKQIIKKDVKNLYYVEDITKKIFLLLYKNDEYLNKKIKKKTEDPYNFKNYYLINKEWLNEYKEYFLYDNIIKKLGKEFNNYSYKRMKTELDAIIKDKIGQIRLFKETIIPDGLKDASKLPTKSKIIQINNKEKELDYQMETSVVEEVDGKVYYIPYEFEIITEDIFELIKKEEFFEKYNEEIENQICYQILFGNKQIIIKNIRNPKFEEKDVFSNELLFYENEDINKDITNLDSNLRFILNFEKKVNFYEEIKMIMKSGWKYYLISKKIKLKDINSIENVYDEKGNVLGKIVNMNIKKEILNDINNGMDFVLVDKNNINIIDDDNKEQNVDEINNNNKKRVSNSKLIIENNPNINDEYINIIDEDEHIENDDIHEDNNIENDNKINDDKENKNILKNNLAPKNKKVYTFEQIKEKFKNIIRIFDYITTSILSTIKEQNNLDLNGLNADEIELKLKGSNIFKIILMNEEEYQNYKKMLNYDKIKKLIDNYKKEKVRENRYKMLEQNKEVLLELFVFFEGKKLVVNENIKIFDDYNICINEINKGKKFFLLSHTNIKNDNKSSVYYFLYNSEPFIYFQESKQILKVHIEDKKSELCKLELHNKAGIIEEYLKSLQDTMNMNKIINNIKMQKEFINEYYLINDKWVDSIKNKNSKKNKYQMNISVKPEYDNNAIMNLKYPKDFGIVMKENNNKVMMETLKHIYMKNEDFVIYKIFININVNTNGKIYLCVIIDSIIYFYSIKNGKYNIKFLIKFNNEEILKNEVEKKISIFGLESYLNFMIINHNEPYKLVDIDFKEIGSLIKISKKFEILKKREFPYMKKMRDEYIKVYSILECLFNIKELKDYIIKDNKLIEDSFSFHFFQILRIMWNYPERYEIQNSNEFENLFSSFLIQLQELSKDYNKNIFDDIKLLMETIVLELQKDLYKSNFNKDFIFNDKLYRDLNTINKLNEKIFFQELFFFDVELSQKCKCQNNCTYYRKYFLEFNIDEKDKDKSIDIKTLFKNLDDTEVCEKNHKMTITRKLITLPKYLIITLNFNNKALKYYPKKLDCNDISNCKNGKTEYELISFIDEKKSVPICKSPVNDKWYKYDAEISEDSKNKERSLPILLIFKQTK